MSNWKPIDDAPGYFVSRFGDVYSTKSGRELSQRSLPRTGYKIVNLFVGGHITERVHRLVAAAFIGPCPDGLQVRHKDGDPSNNCADNLTYGTATENRHDRRRHGTHGSKLTEVEVAAIRDDPRLQRVIAEEYGLTQSYVSAIKRKKAWQHV